MDYKGCKGFTLIELSIVLVVIGLIVATISGGRALIQAAEVRSVIAELKLFQTSINLFKDKYDAIPGDMSNASSYWPLCATVPADCDGDGNNQIDTSAESLRAWQQLSDSQLVAGTYSGLGNFELIVNVPASAMNGGAYILSYGTVHGRVGNYLQLGKISGVAAIADSIMAVPQAVSLDKKIDDGKAIFGNFLAQDGADATALDCINTALTPDDYNLSKSDVVGCNIIFMMD